MSKKKNRDSNVAESLGIGTSDDLKPPFIEVDIEGGSNTRPAFDYLRTHSLGLGIVVLIFILGLAVMAKNGWLPSTDPLTGKKTGWFGKELPANATSVWNPLAMPTATPTPQLSKEYVYAGSRLLSIEDPNAGTGSISGNIDYAIVSKGVPNVSLTGAGSPSVSATSNSSGNYSVTGFGSGSYTVTPSKTTQPCGTINGITSFDASMAASYAAGTLDLTSDQITAADVSQNGSVTGFDASEIASWAVGFCTPADAGVTAQWRFSPSSTTHSSVSTSITDNYKAYLMGDISGNWKNTLPNAPISENSADPNAIRASISNIELKTGSIAVVPFILNNLNKSEVISLQFDIAYDPAVLKPDSVAADLSNTLASRFEIRWNIREPGLLSVAIYGPYAGRDDGVYANLRFQTIGGVGSRSLVGIRSFRFNDEKLPTTTQDGQVTVISGQNGMNKKL